MKEKKTQAYKQAPWRIQTQWIGFFFVTLVLTGVIAGVYLNVTARTTEAGIAVRSLTGDRSALRQSNASLESQLALITTEEEMRNRALDLGYELQQTENTVYLVVPGYTGRKGEQDAPTVTNILPPTVIKPSYTQSLWEWFFNALPEPSQFTGGVQ